MVLLVLRPSQGRCSASPALCVSSGSPIFLDMSPMRLGGAFPSGGIHADGAASLLGIPPWPEAYLPIGNGDASALRPGDYTSGLGGGSGPAGGCPGLIGPLPSSTLHKKILNGDLDGHMHGLLWIPWIPIRTRVYLHTPVPATRGLPAAARHMHTHTKNLA